MSKSRPLIRHGTERGPFTLLSTERIAMDYTRLIDQTATEERKLTCTHWTVSPE